MKKFLVMALLFLSACASVPHLPDNKEAEPRTMAGDFLEADNTPSPAVTENSAIRPGFLIRLSNKIDAKLEGSFRVALDGSLKLPYNVTLMTSSLSLKALTTKVNESYQKYFKASPQIQVSIAERKYYIDVGGIVKKPGPMLVSEREKIEDIIKNSSDGNIGTEARVVQITRGENNYYLDMQEYYQGLGANRSPRWYGGERVLFLKSSPALNPDDSATIQILGDFKNPGGVAFKNGADFYYYLVKVGGTTATSDLERVQVIRQTPQGRAVTNGSAEDIAKYIHLSPGDTVILSSNLPGKYERNLQLGSTIATILSAIGILIIAL